MKVVVRLVVLTAVLALSVVAVAPAAAAPLALPPQPGSILGVHMVQAGETLASIGCAYKVDPNAIAQMNGTASPAVGQKLNIPAVLWVNMPAGQACAAPQFSVALWPPPDPSTIFGTHTVQPGEWIYSIARAYRVNPMAIAQASGIPGPYTPSCGGCGWYPQPTLYGGCGTCGRYYYGGCGGYYGGCGGWQSYPCGWCGGPWNFVYPGQVLKIPAVPWWGYNTPPGPTAAPQATVTLPAGW